MFMYFISCCAQPVCDSHISCVRAVTVAGNSRIPATQWWILQIQEINSRLSESEIMHEHIKPQQDQYNVKIQHSYACNSKNQYNVNFATTLITCIHQTNKCECTTGATGVRQLPGAGRAPVPLKLSVCMTHASVLSKRGNEQRANISSNFFFTDV